MNDWLRVMNSLAGEEEEDQVDNYTPQKPHFEHIWMVTALNKGLGSKENIIGLYRLCLTSKELTLLKVGDHDSRNGVVKFPVSGSLVKLPHFTYFPNDSSIHFAIIIVKKSVKDGDKKTVIWYHSAESK